MQLLTKKKVLERLAKEIGSASPAGLAAYHNQLYSPEKITATQAKQDPAAVLAKIRERMADGLFPEDIVELWNVVVVDPRCAGYDEEDDRYQVRPLLPVPADF